MALSTEQKTSLARFDGLGTDPGVTDAAKKFALHLLKNVPDHRNRSLALTHIQEAVFWASAGVAQDQPAAPTGEQISAALNTETEPKRRGRPRKQAEPAESPSNVVEMPAAQTGRRRPRAADL